jgi:hypothetical protein
VSTGSLEAATQLERAEAPANGVVWHAQPWDIPATLWAACFPPPLEGLFWYESLARAGLEDQFGFAYGVVMQDGKAVAIAPVFTMDLPMDLVAPPAVAWVLGFAGGLVRWLRVQRTLFVGSPCSDEGTVGMLAGTSLADVAPILQPALVERARATQSIMIVWKDFPDAAVPDLRALARTHGLFEVTSFPGARLPLAPTFEAYLGKLSVKQRHNLRKKLRLSRDLIALDTAILAKPDARTLEEVGRLFQNTYSKATTKFERLTPAFWSEITARDESRVILLRRADTGEAVAFMLAFALGERAINKYIGIDYTQGEKSYLYFRLWEAFLRWAIDIGAREVQSGQTSYPAKLDIGHQLVPLTNFARHRNPIAHWAFALAAKGISWSSLDEGLRQLKGKRQ